MNTKSESKSSSQNVFFSEGLRVWATLKLNRRAAGGRRCSKKMTAVHLLGQKVLGFIYRVLCVHVLCSWVGQHVTPVAEDRLFTVTVCYEVHKAPCFTGNAFQWRLQKLAPHAWTQFFLWI